MQAAAYARFSTDKQTENSIAYQLTAIGEYCGKNNIQITHTYTDEAYSGTNTDRPGFREMVSSAARREFEAVVVYDISRGSRDVADWFDFRKTMAHLGVQVVAVENRLGDVLNPNDFLTELISVGLGQHQVLATRQKSIAGMAERAKKGVFCGGVPPLGYDVSSTGDYLINEREAALVRQIFSLYASGASYSIILDSIGKAYGKAGRPIGKNSLSSILRNERYVGTYTWNKYNTRSMRQWIGYNPNPKAIRIEGQIPAIIDAETWGRVQTRMNNRKHAENKAKREYLLSGIIECTQCGATYVGHASVNSRGYENRYYVCGNKYRTRTCKSHNLKCEEIDSFVVAQLKSYLQDQNLSELAVTVAAQVNAASADLTAEKKELSEIKKQIENGMKAILSGLIFPELQEKIDNLRIRQSELEDIIRSRATDIHVDPKAIEERLRWAIDHLDTNRKEVVKALINKIYANPNGDYTVQIGVHFVAPQDGLEPSTS